MQYAIHFDDPKFLFLLNELNSWNLQANNAGKRGAAADISLGWLGKFYK